LTYLSAWLHGRTKRNGKILIMSIKSIRKSKTTID
jgi:hypothetical protein